MAMRALLKPSESPTSRRLRMRQTSKKPVIRDATLAIALAILVTGAMALWTAYGSVSPQGSSLAHDRHTDQSGYFLPRHAGQGSSRHAR